MKAGGRGEMLRTDIRLAESFLGLLPMSFRDKTIEDLAFIKKELHAKVRARLAESKTEE